jgi:hypothetical protein
MTSFDKDLNVSNYEYEDLLNVYKIPDNFHEKNINILNNKLSQVQNSYSNNIYEFYLKAYKMILTIYKLKNQNSLNNNIPFYIEKIKKIPFFETLTVDDIITKINKNIMFQDYNPGILNVINPVELEKEPSIETISLGLNNNFIPENKKNFITNSFPNTVAPGDLNSLKRISQYQNLNLNTCFRNNYYTTSPTDFQYIIPSDIKNVISLRLASLELPNSWYLFSSNKKNNVFQIQVTTDKCCQKFTIIIPDGNYDSDSLTAYLNTTYFYDSSNDDNLKYIKFSIDPFNNKSIFEIVRPPTISKACVNVSFNLYFVENSSQNIMETFGWIIGFRLANYLEIVEKRVSEGLFDAGGDRYVYFSINDYQYNTNVLNIVGFDKSILDDNIIAKIPMINGKLSLIIEDNNNPLSKIRRYNGPVNIRQLQIKIMDKFGSVIDLNNMDFSFTLELEILYESFNFKNVFG